ncbi:MAG TPA: SAM-dependent methyltransferase [Gammaproteobacteria bacterium]|nr:SAM-dependent methyltransferase [Gammaproteobacteria bacterium]
MTSALDLPTPADAALRTSETLAAEIRAAIERAGGWLDFARYMELALYAPGLGYYSAGSAKLGAAGDFVTAPELSGALGRALARTLEHELAGLAAPAVLELGAGSGALAAQILDALEARGDARTAYRILEPSADLRERQQSALRRFGSRVAWLDGLPSTPFEGAIVANEVADALPVSRFVKRAGEARPLGVELRGGRFVWAEGPGDAELAAAVAAIERELDAPLEDGYRSEICRPLPAWLAALAGCLTRGAVLLVDYGLTRREYYHPQRHAGTLVCHYRHRAHDDPFLYPGLQDISAWVDFSACAHAASAAGFTVAGFTTQAQYLVASLAADPPRPADGVAGLKELAALKTLLLPGEMGERFKVMLLRKHGALAPLPGRDLRNRL